METKICTKCGLEKVISEFCKSWGYCKECRKLYDKKYFQNNKESILKRHKRWWKENKDRYRIYTTRWYENNKESWRLYNKDKIKRYTREYQKNNRDKENAKAARRRARKLNQTPLLTIEEKQRIQKIYSTCSLMNEISINIKWHVDHIIPLSKGGPHYPDNLQILEAGANLKKSGNIIEGDLNNLRKYQV